MTVERRGRRIVAACLALLFLVGGSGLGPRIHLHGHHGEGGAHAPTGAEAEAPTADGPSVHADLAPVPAARASASSCHGGAEHGHGSHGSGECTCIGACHVGSTAPLLTADSSVDRDRLRERLPVGPSRSGLAVPSPTRHLPPLPNGPPTFL